MTSCEDCVAAFQAIDERLSKRHPLIASKIGSIGTERLGDQDYGVCINLSREKVPRSLPRIAARTLARIGMEDIPLNIRHNMPDATACSDVMPNPSEQS